MEFMFDDGEYSVCLRIEETLGFYVEVSKGGEVVERFCWGEEAICDR